MKSNLAIALVTLAGAACAQPTVMELDPAQTRIEFTLGSLLHTVHGSFRLKQGTIRFDPATGAACLDFTSASATTDWRLLLAIDQISTGFRPGKAFA